jgi:hypothetical protein
LFSLLDGVGCADKFPVSKKESNTIENNDFIEK